VVVDGSRHRADGFRQVAALIAHDPPAALIVDREARRPLLFFSGYRLNMPLAVLRPEETTYRLVDLSGQPYGDDGFALSRPLTYAVAGTPDARAWLARRPELTLRRRIPPTDTLYRRLLQSEWFRALLAAVR